MEKEFVKYTEALALKTLGFDEPCLGYYAGDILCTGQPREIHLDKDGNYKKTKTESYPIVFAPTFSQAFRWFEDNHQLYPAVVIDQTSYPKYAFEIANFFGNPKDLTEKDWGWNEMILSRSLYRTRTEAELECLKKLIEIVKEK